MKIVLIGSPGSGKGTLGNALAKRYNLQNISVGQAIRSAATNNKKLKTIIDAGGLLDDLTVQNILETNLANLGLQDNYILDGYPRTIGQAQHLRQKIKPDIIFLLNIRADEILRRLAKRVTCSKCGMIYGGLKHKTATCAKCGAPLVVRGDDNIQSIQKRIEVYEQTMPQILNVLKDMVVELPAEKSPEQVFESAVNALEKCKKGVEI